MYMILNVLDDENFNFVPKNHLLALRLRENVQGTYFYESLHEVLW